MSGVEPGESGQPGLAELLTGALNQVREVAAAFARLADVRVEQARLTTRRVLVLTALALWLAVVVLAATVLAVSYALAGLAGLLAQSCGGKIWIGDLAAGGIVLALILVAGLIARGSMQRANLRRLQRKFEADPGEPRT